MPKTEKMNPALQKEIERLRKKIATATALDALTRREIGEFVKKVRNGRGKYGKRVMQQVEQALGFDSNTLRRFEAVATVWTGVELKKLLRRKNSKGLPLTWSHLSILADVKTEARRERLIEKALEKAWSVRELALEAYPHSGATNEPMGNDPQARCIQIRQVTSRVVEVTKSVSRLDLLLDVADVSAAPEYQGAVETAAKAYSELRSACDEAITKLEGKLKQASPAPSPVAAVV